MAPSNQNNSFIQKAESLVLDNLSNEQFGVSELAAALFMSRSNLLRKIKKHTEKSASQFIRQIRLNKAAELLIETELTASEVSFEVGFSNTSYFTKCYREYFGYPPGETKSKIQEQKVEDAKEAERQAALPGNEIKKGFIAKHKITISLLVIVLISIGYYFSNRFLGTTSIAGKEKSIAVLPFKNLSEDNTNLYFIDGIMEASLNNLQKIGDLRVISRTSTEKYRSNPKTVSEIGEELSVNYLVEGSGQKLGNSVLVRIQLIDVKQDSPIWSEQYQYQLENVFSLQNTIAKKIAFAIEANVTPTELANIDKKPTDNIVAYDYYLKGLAYQKEETEEGLRNAIENFEKAIKEDTDFANAYAQIAISYYFLDYRKMDKKHLEKLNQNADQALLFDAKSELSLIAKALYYISVSEFKLAVPHLEKALEYNPNASSAILMLSDMYARVVPNTSKYLTYALKGIKLNIEANDSITKSFIYLNLSNALVQNGFAKEALTYIDASLRYNPKNAYAPYLKHFIEYANEPDLAELASGLIKEWEKDTTRIDITQEIGKIFYFQEDYKKAYEYYQKYIALKENGNQVDVFPAENLKIAMVYEKMGQVEKAKEFLDAYKRYVANDDSIYKEASLAALYIYENNNDAAIEAYQKFSLQEDYQYWVLLFLEKDPLIKKLKSHSKYTETLLKIESQFWKRHTELSISLENNNLL